MSDEPLAARGADWPGVAKSKAEAQACGLKYYHPEKPCKNGSMAPRQLFDGGGSACTCCPCKADRVRQTIECRQRPKDQKDKRYRSKALALGLPLYQTGKLCKNGNLAVRRTSDARCICAACRAEVVARTAEWRRTPRGRECAALRRKTLGESLRERKHAEYARNKEAYFANVYKWQAQNPERVAKYKQTWKAHNPDKNLAHKKKRDAARVHAIPTWFSDWDQFVIEQAAELMMRRREMTGFDWHVDHMIPMQARKACGLHCAANIQVIPQKLNNWKWNRLLLTEPGEWLRYV